jgi:hypothetical protein
LIAGVKYRLRFGASGASGLERHCRSRVADHGRGGRHGLDRAFKVNFLRMAADLTCEMEIVRAQALGTVGDVDRMSQVDDREPHDFAESQRYDCQLVTAQLRRGCADHDAEQGGASKAPRRIVIHQGACRPAGNIAAIQAKLSVRCGEVSSANR